MNHTIEHLQELNSLLADCAEILTAAAGHAPLTPQARDALRQVYDLQARVARRLHALLEAEGPRAATPRASSPLHTDPVLRNFRDAVRQSKQRQKGIEQLIGQRRLDDGLHRLHQMLGRTESPGEPPTIMLVLGPNKFPDDVPSPPPRPEAREP